MNSFFMSSCRGQCLLPPVSDYAADIRLALVYLRKERDHLRSLHLKNLKQRNVYTECLQKRHILLQKFIFINTI